MYWALPNLVVLPAVLRASGTATRLVAWCIVLCFRTWPTWSCRNLVRHADQRTLNPNTPRGSRWNTARALQHRVFVHLRIDQHADVRLQIGGSSLPSMSPEVLDVLCLARPSGRSPVLCS